MRTQQDQSVKAKLEMRKMKAQILAQENSGYLKKSPIGNQTLG